jgi:flagellar basal body L-ring protein FlgH
MKFLRFGIAAALFSAAALTLGAESLWTTGFQGYLLGTTAVRPGDILTVIVDSSSSLSFEASSNDAKSITLEFSGGEFGNLFSFLPLGRTGGTQAVKGAQEYELASEISARVVETDSAGAVRIEGSRGVSIQGREEQLTVSGWLDPNALGAERRVHFSRLADSRLSFRTFLQPATATLTAADIEEAVAALETALAPGPGPAVAPGAPTGIAPAGAVPAAPPGAAAQPGAAPAAGVGQPGAVAAPLATTYRLSDEKKVELFLQYINRLVDVLFQ